MFSGIEKVTVSGAGPDIGDAVIFGLFRYHHPPAPATITARTAINKAVLENTRFIKLWVLSCMNKNFPFPTPHGSSRCLSRLFCCFRRGCSSPAADESSNYIKRSPHIWKMQTRICRLDALLQHQIYKTICGEGGIRSHIKRWCVFARPRLSNRDSVRRSATRRRAGGRTTLPRDLASARCPLRLSNPSRYSQRRHEKMRPRRIYFISLRRGRDSNIVRIL